MNLYLYHYTAVYALTHGIQQNQLDLHSFQATSGRTGASALRPL
jgi:hypothetical protein